jgi:hypothetical protein
MLAKYLRRVDGAVERRRPGRIFARLTPVADLKRPDY